jgi:hypothetical protein
MMQDIPKAFAPGARVGFTVVNQVRLLCCWCAVLLRLLLCRLLCVCVALKTS